MICKVLKIIKVDFPKIQVMFNDSTIREIDFSTLYGEHPGNMVEELISNEQLFNTVVLEDYHLSWHDLSRESLTLHGKEQVYFTPDNDPLFDGSTLVFKPTFGDILKKWRKLAGMTMEDVAAKIGADKSYISKIESGKEVEYSTIVKLMTVAFDKKQFELEDLY